MTLETFFEKFDLFAAAPDAVAKIRELVLELAVQGRLVEQRPRDLSAIDCIRKANKPLIDFAPDQSKETPIGWVALPLGCLIASNTGGGTPSKANPDYWNGPIPWASVKDIKSDKYLTSTIDSITEIGLKNSSSNLISPRRLLVVTRMGLGKLAINKVPVAINQDLRAIEPTTALDLDFAYLLFKSLKIVGSGVTVKGITVDKLHAMLVLLPPLAEQKRIVAKVDELMALCDRLEAQQQEREQQGSALARASLARFAEAPTPANLDWLFHSAFSVAPAELRKSILTLALQGKLVPQDPNDEPAQKLIARLTPRLGAKGTRRPRRETVPVPVAEVEMLLPSGWASTTLETLADVNWGNTSLTKSSYTESGFPAYSATGPDGLIDHAEFSGPGIVLSAIGARSGKCFLASGEWTAIKNTITILPHDPIDTDWLFLVTNIEDAWKRRGGAQPFIALKDALTFGVRVPPLAEQRRIVAKVDELMAWVDALETQLATARTTAANLLAAAVAELTNGNEAHAAAEV